AAGRARAADDARAQDGAARAARRAPGQPSAPRARDGVRARSAGIHPQEITPLGVIAAGHPVTAQSGADVLRAGGNAVDAAIAACLASWTAEPLLTGPGAGGYLLVAGTGVGPSLLDFFVAAPAEGRRPALRAAGASLGEPG